MINRLREGFLTNNQLKILAIIFMTVDHIGVHLFPEYVVLRYIGRLALPIFAFMIAEGCRYTKNRKKYLGTIAAYAAVCQIAYFVAMHSLDMCILVTFMLSVIVNFLLDNLTRKKDFKTLTAFVLGLVTVFVITEILPGLIKSISFSVDYGFWGVMMPVLIYPGDKKSTKLALTAVGMLMLVIAKGDIQLYAFISLILLAMYNGKRGTLKMKNFFYIYYPLHMAAIHLIKILFFK